MLDLVSYDIMDTYDFCFYTCHLIILGRYLSTIIIVSFCFCKSRYKNANALQSCRGGRDGFSGHNAYFARNKLLRLGYRKLQSSRREHLTMHITSLPIFSNIDFFKPNNPTATVRLIEPPPPLRVSQSPQSCAFRQIY